MPPRHCPSCGGWLDRAGKCGTTSCQHWRGRRPAAPSASKAIPIAQPPVQAAPAPTPPPAAAKTADPPEIDHESWWAAIKRIERETRTPRPTASGRCPTCGAVEAATLEGALGFHLCKGTAKEALKSFLALVDSAIGNY